jgi:DNA damage-inducible protein 1
VQMMPFLSCKWCIFLWQQELSQTEAKVQRLVELGFDRRTVIQALTLFNGNEEQAASYLFGGF